MSSVTIIVNSCDKYEDAWEPFFTILSHQWPDCPYKFVINTETKEYHTDLFDVQTIHPYSGGKLTWSRRFREILEQIDSEFILFMIEDFFVLSPVNTKVFTHAVNIMKKNDNVGSIVLAQTNRENIKTDDYEDEFFYSRKIDKNNKVWCRTVLYRKNYLEKIIRDFESIWNFEWYVTYRAKKLPYLMLQQKNESDEVFTVKLNYEDGLGIRGSKWLPGNGDLFAQYGIHVDFSKLGILETNEMQSESVPNTTIIPKEQLTLKKRIREKLYLIKWFGKQIRKKLLKIRHYF